MENFEYNTPSASSEDSTVSKLQEGVQARTDKVADLATQPIRVGTDVLDLDPEHDESVQRKQELASQIEKQQEVNKERILKEKRKDEISGETAKAAQTKDEHKEIYHARKDAMKDMVKEGDRRGVDDLIDARVERPRIERRKKFVEDRVAKLSNIEGSIEDVANLEEADLEALDNAMFREAISIHLRGLKRNEQHLEAVTKKNERERSRVAREKILVGIYDKIDKILRVGQSVGPFANLAKRAALNKDIPEYKDGGEEYHAQQRAESSEERLQGFLNDIREDIEDAILENQEELGIIAGEESSNKEQSSIVNLIRERVRMRKVARGEIQSAKDRMKEQISKEDERLSRSVSDISSKGINEYIEAPGSDSYEEYLDKIASSVVAAKSQDETIAHQQAAIESDRANLAGLTAKTLGEKYRSDDPADRRAAHEQIMKAFSRINSDRASRGLEPMSEEERQNVAQRLIET